MRASSSLGLLLALFSVACDAPTTSDDAAVPDDAQLSGDAAPDAEVTDAGVDAGPRDDASVPACDELPACAAVWEERAAARLDSITTDTSALASFLRDMPKGGDLHNHLTGAVYAETFLAWGREEGDCIVPTTHTAVYAAMCGASTRAVPTSGSFYDEIVRAWSMQDFVPGAESGHDHFFATFGKFGAIAGAHRDDNIADVATRAADENQLYVETMFNLGREVGALSAGIWPGTTMTAADLPALYDMIVASPSFASAVAQDAATVNGARTGYRGVLGCAAGTPPAACAVEVRFVSQVSRTGPNDQIFGQLVSAFEVARTSSQLVGVNLSSPEDDSRSLANYDLHMAMLGFLHERYTVPGTSPLHVTLHAGELTREYLPAGSTADTFHIRAAVEVAHAERIGHGIDILSETGSDEILAAMAERQVLVEVCLSSNDQILEISGDAHPLSTYLSAGVPIALATDDQGVSRSSLAGEHVRAVRDQHLGYLDLKTMARQSLEHAFLPGASLWSDVAAGAMVADCAPAETPSASCQALLDGSERARIQWALEQRFYAFERAIR